jgi:hypothetical protein
MNKKIRLLKNNDNMELSDFEWARKVYEFLQDNIKLSKKKAFQIIYYLQEHFPVIPDHIEQCSICGELYDSYSQGHHSELTGKFYCSEYCEPTGLHKREERAEKRKYAPFQRWLKQIKKEQKHYPSLKGKELSETYLRGYFEAGTTPIETLNDIITITHT